MPIRQYVFFALYEADEKTWVTSIAEEPVVGLRATAQKLGELGWEIISVVPIHEPEGGGNGLERSSDSDPASMFAIFVKMV